MLCYHRIGGPLELGVTRVGRRVFERQMRTLAAQGWRSLTLAEYEDRLANRRPAGREFLLTFDDGYASLVPNAFPLLAELGFTATVFLVTDHVGRTNTWDARYTWRRLAHLDWRDAEQWRARGFTFGSHGATHRRLTWLDDEAVRAELVRSRTVLRARLGEDATSAIAYPFGAADERVRRLARDAGYRLGFGGVRGVRGNALGIGRVPVYVWDRTAIPLGLRSDLLGRAGRCIADVANRCAVGTSVMLAARRGPRDGPAAGAETPQRAR